MILFVLDSVLAVRSGEVVGALLNEGNFEQ
jgi:hypothetical protein